ncbi:hypothetical protein H6F67_11005 [Microcoleus sp. FACHB-1515]|uniref:hypothetical protein n=1 Tax=Cyanophyceae TaxID=3028117 RepID=UPI0016888AE2|nr:hypothetical protein [Microcoleus sp. FACHB-1515]MBD2090383.1 hypothetical protein [Microcoleus sp. FACHB-1515]
MNSFQAELIGLVYRHNNRLSLEQIEIVLLRLLELVRAAKDNRTKVSKAVDEAAKNPIS